MKHISSLFIISLLIASGVMVAPSAVEAAKKPTTVKQLNIKDLKQRKATLKWKKKGAAKYYKVQLQDASGDELKKWSNVGNRKKKIKKSLGLLDPSTTYSYRVKACNNKGCSAWSNKYIFTTNGSPAADPNEGVDSSILALEAEVFDLINDYRNSQGLADLDQNAHIAAIAREHSADMANGSGELNHDGFNDRAIDMINLLNPSGWGAAENVAYATDRPGIAQVIADGWIASEGHHANIVGNYSVSGMGIAQRENGAYYFTQLFFRTQ